MGPHVGLLSPGCRWPLGVQREGRAGPALSPPSTPLFRVPWSLLPDVPAPVTQAPWPVTASGCLPVASSLLRGQLLRWLPVPGEGGDSDSGCDLCLPEMETVLSWFFSLPAINRLYYEFGQVPDSYWKMFMRFVGLEENDIDICEHENPGSVMEQHHQMLLRWRNKLGREASAFKLLAALHKLGRHADLHNIINNLVAENILGRHAETPN